MICFLGGGMEDEDTDLTMANDNDNDGSIEGEMMERV